MDNIPRIVNDLGYSAGDDRWCLDVGWQLARLEFFFRNESFKGSPLGDAQAKAQAEVIDELKGVLAERRIPLHDEAATFPDLMSRLFKDLRTTTDDRHLSFVWIGIGAERLAMALNLPEHDKSPELESLARSCITQVSSAYLSDKAAFFALMKNKAIRSVPELEDLLVQVSQQAPTKHQAEQGDVITVLFLAADPSDAARLRLGQEAREIQQMLSVAKLRDQFRLELRFAARIPDLTQAILDLRPRIVHFSGHGTEHGEICLEGAGGETQPVSPGSLSNLFRLVKEHVECVILNACYSAAQAEAIGTHIHSVIGMKEAIGDKAAIAFAIGFYQALGAGRGIGDAFEFGRVHIGLYDLPDELTPILLSR